jgi:hypothetical protein
MDNWFFVGIDEVLIVMLVDDGLGYMENVLIAGVFSNPTFWHEAVTSSTLLQPGALSWISIKAPGPAK